MSKIPAPLLFLGLTLVPAPLAAALWTDGHGDFRLEYSASPSPAFTYQWIIGDGGEAATVDGVAVYEAVYAPSELMPVAGAGTVPSPAPPLTGGTHLHLIPQDGTDAGILGSPYQGWSLGSIAAGLFTGNQVTLTLTAITGPGQVSLWTDDGFGGADFRWSTVDGFSAEDILTLTTGGHSHFNLGFSHPGEYTLEVQAEALLTAGGPVSSPLILTYHAVPESRPVICLLSAAAILSSLRKRRA